MTLEKFDFNTIKNKKQQICFVCTGNTCRSPMAAAVLNHIGAKYDFHAESAGIYAHTGDMISANACQALKDAGIPSTPDNDYESHCARVITEKIMRGCDRIVGITSSHAMSLMTMFPDYAGKIESLPHDVSDPFGGDSDDYRKCLEQITEEIRELFRLND